MDILIIFMRYAQEIQSHAKSPTVGCASWNWLKNEYKVGEVVRVIKKNNSAPTDTEIMNQVPKWDAVVTGVGD